MPRSDSRTAYDVLTFGEAMAMFIADDQGPLAQVTRFHRRTAGADTNVAIGLSRLGFDVRWLSRVGADHNGIFLQRALEAEGLDCRHVRQDAANATGLIFKERAVDGADPHVEYVRRGSAASHLSIADASDVELEAARHLHATGIPPAISDSARELSFHLLRQARRAGLSVSFDPNLRPSLWPSEAVMIETLNALAAEADIVMPGLGEGRLLTGRETAHDIAGDYLDRGARAVVIKLGPEGSYFRTADSEGTVDGSPVEQVIDTVGAGDGFAVGIVSAYLDGLDWHAALHRGNLIGARQVQVIGDMEGLPNREQLVAMERSGDAR
ncbi:sugar kinase [Salinicola acroporae]|uniref:2-dehydro-3-deoxygluconokinase n=1 Tax=Salinicola acroporae TaxID=1541440 RepID=A0ABT6I3B8_9GAMM|nr:sugar kinase [Salinicola acroporae]MDH4571963.1 2-dehydro-3-deoxygluconokinase [Salinicola acroporae]